MWTGVLLTLGRIWMSVCGLAATTAALVYVDPASFGRYAVASSIGLLVYAAIGAGAQEGVLARTHAPAPAQAFSTYTGLAGALILVGLAFAAAELGQPIAQATVLVYAVSCLLWGLTCIADAEAIRDGQGRRILVAGVISDSLNLLVTILALLAGYGIYALLIGKFVQTVLYYGLFSLQMRRALVPRFGLRNFPDFGRRFFVFLMPRLSGWAESYAADLIIGALVSPLAAGQFRLAARFSAAFQAIVISVLNIVVTAEIGRKTHRALQNARAIRIAVPAVAAVGFCALAFSLVIGAALVRFGQAGWEDSATILLWLSVAMPSTVVGGALVALLTSHRATRLIAKLQVVRLTLPTLGLFAGAAFGAVASAAARSVLHPLAILVFMRQAIRHPGHFGAIRSILLRQTLVALCVALTAEGVRLWSGSLAPRWAFPLLLGVAACAQAVLAPSELLRAGTEIRLYRARVRAKRRPRGIAVQ